MLQISNEMEDMTLHDEGRVASSHNRVENMSHLINIKMYKSEHKSRLANV